MEKSFNNKIAELEARISSILNSDLIAEPEKRFLVSKLKQVIKANRDAIKANNELIKVLEK